MEGNGRIWFTPKQKAELWERWKSGQCVADVKRFSLQINTDHVFGTHRASRGVRTSAVRCRAYSKSRIGVNSCPRAPPARGSIADHADGVGTPRRFIAEQTE